MKKAFYYNFIQTKEEEDASKANNTTLTPYQVIPRVLVELHSTRPLHNKQQLQPPRHGYFPMMDNYPNNPWQIEKTLTHYEVISGRLIVPFIDVFEHVLRYWSLSTANRLVLGHKVTVILYDSTDQANPKRYKGDAVYVEILPNDDYSFSCLDLFKDRFLKVGDEIGLFWDQNASNFQFKLQRRAA